jgi:alpha-beta hydrolase superfamily lysophospholipase
MESSSGIATCAAIAHPAEVQRACAHGRAGLAQMAHPLRWDWIGHSDSRRTSSHRAAGALGWKRMIIRTEEVVQVIDGDRRARFTKDIVHVDGAVPLVMVRKRLAGTAEPRTPLLLMHGFGQNRYAWHLSSRSLANHLAAEGFDVFNLDFRGHGRSRRIGATRARGIDDYVQHDVPAAVRELSAITGNARVFALGHSLGGLLACAAASTIVDALAGIVAVAPPYRFARGNRTLVAFSHAAEALANVGVLPRGPGLIPVRWIGRWLHLYRHAWNTRLLPIPVRAWHPGALEPELLREYLLRSFDSATWGTLLQITRLATSGELRSLDGTIDYGARFEACDLPLLVIAGDRDLLAPPASVRPLYDRSRSNDKTYRIVPLGHSDLLLGRDAPSHSWPVITRWLKQRALMVHPAAKAAG